MNACSSETVGLRAAITTHRAALERVLERYGASNPRLFGSVARGDATEMSDIDVLVDLRPDRGNPLMRVAGLSEELSLLLNVKVDVVTESLLREPVSASARRDVVAI